DCATLQASFKASQLAVLSADSSIAAASASQRAAVTSACAGTLAHKASCAHTRSAARKKLQALNQQRVSAARAYYKSIEAARRTFWNAIQALPGGARILPDKSIPVENS